MKKWIFFITFLFPAVIFAQNLEFAGNVMDSLTAPYMHGRGYVKNGDLTAARFIAKKFNAFELKKFESSGNGNRYFQQFRFDINVFPGDMQAKINEKELVPGKEFIVAPNSGGTDGKELLGLIHLSPEDLVSEKAYKKFKKTDKIRHKAVVIDKEKFKDYKENAYFKQVKKNRAKAAALVYLEKDDLVFGKSQKAMTYPVVHILKDALPSDPFVLTLDIDQDIDRDHLSQNVAGYIRGKKYPDSFIVFSAHYDHLGMMGRDTYFPGANDNASGVSMILDLARHYSQPAMKPDYSIAFMAFTAEEAGLLGSYFYTIRPLFPLEKIAVLVNLDLMGNGKDGMMVVNGKVFEHEYNKLVKINKKKHYLTEIKKRGRAANSDHYFFSEKGVTSFFFYLLEEYPYYHDIYDKPGKLSLKGYQGAFRLIRDYVDLREIAE